MNQVWQHYIDGSWADSGDGATLAVENPATEETIGEIALAGRAEVDAAVAAARRCVDERRLTDMAPRERGALIAAMSAWIEDHRDEIAEVLTLDSGKTLTESGWEIDNTTTFLSYYAGIADKIEGRYIPLGASVTDYVIPVPYGVSGHIVPWNYPLEIAARGAGPALAAGNAVVIKSPEVDPLSVTYLAQAAEAVGMPAGSFNVICGHGQEAGAALVEHPGVDQVTFTGSVATGRSVLHAAAERIVPAAVELGGKSAGIVLRDADLDLVTEQVRWAIWGNAGQICSALSRLVVPAELHDELIDRLVQRAGSLSIGQGMDDPDMGPLASAAQLQRVEHHVSVGLSEGCTLATGGRRIDRVGHFFEPTVFANVTNDQHVAREEIFGPVLSVITYDTVEDALKIANDSPYGLVAGVFGNDLAATTWLADRLDAGQIFVNDWFVPAVEGPFGGFKQSGFGREKGQAALESYLQWKNVAITRP